MKTTYSVKGFAKAIRVSPSTVRRWDQSGVLPAKRTQSGHRYYLESDIQEFKDQRENSGKKRIADVLITEIYVGEGDEPAVAHSSPSLMLAKNGKDWERFIGNADVNLVPVERVLHTEAAAILEYKRLAFSGVNPDSVQIYYSLDETKRGIVVLGAMKFEVYEDGSFDSLPVPLSTHDLNRTPEQEYDQLVENWGKCAHLRRRYSSKSRIMKQAARLKQYRKKWAHYLPDLLKDGKNVTAECLEFAAIVLNREDWKTTLNMSFLWPAIVQGVQHMGDQEHEDFLNTLYEMDREHQLIRYQYLAQAISDMIADSRVRRAVIASLQTK